MPATLYSRYYRQGTIEAHGDVSLTQRPTPPPQVYPDSLTHVIKGGETLDQLAAHYYQREDLWWRIADANPGRFPLDWQPGDILIIPPIRVATRTPRR